LSGEVELALRRERSVSYYQEAFARVAERTAELLDLTSDLAFIGSQERAAAGPVRTATLLGGVFESLAARFARRPTARVAIEPVMGELWVEGDETQVVGAMAVLIELAVRTRRDGARIHVRAGAPDDGVAGATDLDVTLAAEPGGLWPLDSGAGRGITPVNRIAFAAVARALERCGGSAAVVPFPGGNGLRIRLRRTERTREPA
jgi:signal transduction histidine kinase